MNPLLTDEENRFVDQDIIPDSWSDVLPDLIGRKQLARLLGISLNSLDKLRKEKAIPFIHINLFGRSKHRVAFEKESIKAWYREKMTEFMPGKE